MIDKFDRRGFLKAAMLGSAAVAAGVGMAGCVPSAQSSDAGLAATGSDVPDTWDEECDVLVVGSGFAGLAAAYEAANAGANVLVVEKMGMTGGNSCYAGGWMAVCNSTAQKDQGIEDSVDTYVSDMLTAGLNLNDVEKCKLVAEKSNETWEWTVNEIGVEWTKNSEGNYDLVPQGGHTIIRSFVPAQGSGSGITTPLTEKITELGVAIKTDCMLVKIIRDAEGRVVGIQAQDGAKNNDPETGKPIYIKANKGVVLANGGFGADVEWRMQHDPRLDDTLDCTNQPGATAECLAAAMRAGALAVHLDWIQLGPWCSPDEKGYGAGPNYIDGNVGYGMSIDPRSGQRVVNELADRRIYSNAIIDNGVPLIQVVDEQNIPEWNSGMYLDLAMEAGITKKFDTIDEVIEAYELPREDFLAQLERYNGFVEKGVDEEFGKLIPDDAVPIGDGPFYITRIWPKVHHCMGGLKADMNTCVLDVDLNPIPGLFAAGEATGGVHGACRLGTCATTECLVNGRIAGKAAAGVEA